MLRAAAAAFTMFDVVYREVAGKVFTAWRKIRNGKWIGRDSASGSPAPPRPRKGRPRACEFTADRGG